MHRRWQRVSAVATLTLVLTGTWVAPTAAKDPSKGTAGPTLQAAAIPGLAMGGDPPTKQVPLRIAITPDLNCAVNKFEDQFGEFFGDTACATLISVNGTLFGPASIPAGGSASPRTAFTPVSQTLTGSGLKSDPWQITTVVDAGTPFGRDGADRESVPRSDQVVVRYLPVEPLEIHERVLNPAKFDCCLTRPQLVDPRAVCFEIAGERHDDRSHPAACLIQEQPAEYGRVFAAVGG